MTERVMTAPLGIIKVDGVPVGKMRNIRVTETIRRGAVRGIGALTPSERAALEWDGNFNCSQYMIDLSREVFKFGLIRKASSLQQWVDTVLLQEDGIQIDIYRRVKAGERDPNTGLYNGQLEIFSSIKAAFATREGFDISEGQISGRDMDFEYNLPILYPI